MAEISGKQLTERALSLREWLLTIAILLMLEGWILNSSYEFRGEQLIINYVSFAATITSLLLAVLAIIYGFYQSDGQQKAAVAMRLEIDSMQRVQATLDVTSRGIADQLSGMTATAAELRRLAEVSEATSAQLGGIAGGISGINVTQAEMKKVLTEVRDKAAGPHATPVAPGTPAESAAIKLLSRTSFHADLLGYALHKYSLSPNNGKLSSAEFLTAHYTGPVSEWKSSPESSFMDKTTAFTIGVQFMAALRAFDLVVSEKQSDKSVVLIHDALKHQLAAIAQACKSSEYTKAGAVKIDDTFAAQGL